MTAFNERLVGLPLALDRLEKDIIDAKSSQRFGGSSMRIKHVKTNNTWDVVGAVLSTANDYSEWRVNINLSSPHYYVEFELDWLLTQGLNDYFVVYSWEDNVNIESLNTRSFKVWMQNNPEETRVVNLKFAFKSPVDGEITWTRTK